MYLLVRHIVNCMKTILLQFTTSEIKTHSCSNLSAAARGCLEAEAPIRGWNEANKGNIFGGGVHAKVTTNGYVWAETHTPPPLGAVQRWDGYCISNT